MSWRLNRVLPAALIMLAGCQGPHAETAIVCHNANCLRPLESSRDDTLEALEASLALEFRGRPVIDGVELDLLWSTEASSCLFAHDSDQRHAAPAAAAAELVAAHLERAGPVTRSDGPFYLKLELKGGVQAADALLHAVCALDVYAVIRDAAERSGRRLRAFFDAKSPELLATLAAHASWPELSALDDVHLSAAFTIPGIGSSAALGDFHAPYDTVSLHPDWTGSAMLRALRSRDIAITLWSQSLGPQQLRAIADLEPVFVSTGDAALLGRWLAD